MRRSRCRRNIILHISPKRAEPNIYSVFIKNDTKKAKSIKIHNQCTANYHQRPHFVCYGSNVHGQRQKPPILSETQNRLQKSFQMDNLGNFLIFKRFFHHKWNVSTTTRSIAFYVIFRVLSSGVSCLLEI